MNLNWKPVIHSLSLIDIPVVAAHYDPTSLKRYVAANEPWLQSNRKRFSVFKEYSELARSGCVVLPFLGENPLRRFNEIHTAFVLNSRGFRCWAGVHFFYDGLDRPKGYKSRVDTTDDVQAFWPWLWPAMIQRDLYFTSRGPGFKLRNPDLVAFSKLSSEWRFCEVKGPREPIGEGQLEALAVLHLLTGAPVAVVRVLPAGDTSSFPAERTRVKFRRHSKLDWIHKRLAS